MTLPTLILLAATAIPAAAPLQAVPVEVGSNSSKRFAFDWNGNDEDGEVYNGEKQIESVEFRYAPVEGGGSPIVRSLATTVGIGTNEVAVKDVLNGVPSGVYDMTIRLIGTGAQPSQYSDVLAIRVRVKNPSRPTNVRVVGP